MRASGVAVLAACRVPSGSDASAAGRSRRPSRRSAAGLLRPRAASGSPALLLRPLRPAPGRLGRCATCASPSAPSPPPLLAPAPPAAAALALREVAQQLAGQRGRLARHAHAGAVEHLLRLGRVRQRGGEQRGRQPAVLLARRPARAGARCARGRRRTSSRAGRAAAWSRASAARRTPRAPRGCTRPGARASAPAWSRRPICFSASACSSTLTPSRRSSRDQPPTISTASSNASASRRLPTSPSARRRSWELRLRCRQVTRKRAAQLAGGVEVQHRLRAAPVVRRHARAGEHRPGVLLAPVRCSTAIRHSSRSKTCARRSRSAVTGTTRRSTRSRRPRPRRTGPTTIAPPR